MRFFQSASLVLVLAALAACARTFGGTTSLPGAPPLQTESRTSAAFENIYVRGSTNNESWLAEYAPNGSLIARRPASDGYSWLRVDPVGNVWSNPGGRRDVWIYRGGDLTKAPVSVHTIWGPGDVAFGDDGKAYLSDIGNGKKDGLIHIYAPGASIELGAYPVRGNWLAIDATGMLFVMDPNRDIEELDTKRGGAPFGSILAGEPVGTCALSRDGSLFVATNLVNTPSLLEVSRGSKAVRWKTSTHYVLGAIALAGNDLYAISLAEGKGILRYAQSDGRFEGKLTSETPWQMQLGADGRLYALFRNATGAEIKIYTLDGSAQPITVGPIAGAGSFAVR